MIAIVLALLLPPPLLFMGRAVTVAAGERDERDEMFPKGPASVCVDFLPIRQCYTAPQEYGNDPTVEVIYIEKNMPALLFSAARGGVSGWAIHFALLRPGRGTSLENIFTPDFSLSNQNQHAFRNDPAISKEPIFLTADYIWGPDEGHYGEHRFRVSAYRPGHSLDDGSISYSLEDQYMTVREYDLDAGSDVLASERQEIFARLKRVKAAEDRRRVPH